MCMRTTIGEWLQNGEDISDVIALYECDELGTLLDEQLDELAVRLQSVTEGQ